MKKLLFLGIALVGGIGCFGQTLQQAGINPFAYKIEKKQVASNGAVAAAHPLASLVGAAILKQGGNAFDAAIATQLALAVVYPNAGNLGGGGFLVGQLSNGKQVAIDYREKAPATAHRDLYIESNGQANTEKSQLGHLAAGVPGTVAGLFATYPYAKLSFDKLINPAIELATNGFCITAAEARGLNAIQQDLKKYNTQAPVFLKEQGWKEGDTLRQPQLATTLTRIKEKGKAGFYEGETAQLIVAEMKRGNGIISLEDLKKYEAVSRTPHRFAYKDVVIVSMPMPSSGGLLLNQMMKMVEDKNLKSMGFHSLASVQLMTEVMRRAYADRAAYMGDADFYPVPVRQLVTPVYLNMRMKDYNPEKATDSKQVNPGKMLPKESEETTHLSVMDSQGNAVAVTTTLNNSYGSRTVIGGAGFFINDEMDDFSVSPGVPNMYGALGGEANAIQPGKRMLSSMTPTIVTKNGKPFIVVGTPGGTTIPNQVFQTLINLLEFELSAEDAVYKPKFHHQWLPDELVTEKGFPEEIKTKLKTMGYQLAKERSGIGRTELIRVLPDGKLEIVADKRGDDSVAGF
ncbi:MAG: gamma-glutamyltransferase [Bacteroidetes bacterium]|nr:gamma-glutamyltransferase [Bacteroidota bacterium]